MEELSKEMLEKTVRIKALENDIFLLIEAYKKKKDLASDMKNAATEAYNLIPPKERELKIAYDELRDLFLKDARRTK